MKIKILVTGFSGFIGFHVCNLLVNNFDIYGVDNMKKKHFIFGLRKENIDNRVNTKKLDIENFEDLNKYISRIKPDLIIHLAAQTGISNSKINPKLYFDTNITGFYNVLECGKLNSIKNIIYASSSSVYGDTKKEVFSENDVITNQLSFYGTTKHINEQLAKNYSLNFGINTYGLRFFTVYGSWTRPDMAAWKFMDAIVNKKEIVLYNNGNVSRDFTHVNDIVKSIELIINKTLVNQAKNNHLIFNIGKGNPISISKYLDEISLNFNIKPIIKYESLPKDEMMNTIADTDLLANYINYIPNTSLKQGVKEMTNWYKKRILPNV